MAPDARVMVKIFDPEVRGKNVNELLNECLPELSSDVVDRFIFRLGQYGYDSQCSSSKERVFLQTSETSYGITVAVARSQIHFSLPVAKLGSLDAIFDLYQTATELCDGGDLAAWIVNDNQWAE